MADLAPAPNSKFTLNYRQLATHFFAVGAVIALFSVLSIFFLYREVNDQRKGASWLMANYTTVSVLNVLARNLYSEHAAVTGYLQTRDPELLKTLQNSPERLAGSLRVMSPLLAANPSQAQFFDEVRESYVHWLETVNEVIESKKKPSKQVVNSHFQKTSFLIDDVIERQQRFISVREESELRTNQKTFRFFISATIILVFLCVVGLVSLYDSISQPIQNLTESIRKFELGDLTARVTVSGKNEIGYLESYFNQMAQALENMVKDLKQVDAMKSTFLSTVSHELRTPLTSISGYVKLILSGDVGPLDEMQKEFLTIVDTNVTRLSSLINDILDVEKIESGRLQLDFKTLDLKSVLKDCEATFGIVAKQKNIALKFEFPSSPDIKVSGDKGRLIQVFMNLISNALKYTKEGTVLVRVERKNSSVQVEVKDSGIGMTLEEQKQLFKKFTRTKSGLQSGEGGTGLGLVIVKELVEAHGGSVWAESEADKGSSFFVSLPTVQGGVVEAPVSEKSKEPLMRDSRSVVWVICTSKPELDEIHAGMNEAKSVLGGREFDVVLLESSQAVPYVSHQSEAPALIVYDAALDGEGVEEALMELRIRTQGFSPIIVLGSVADALVAFSSGASALIMRPIHRQRLITSIKNALGTKTARVLLADPNRDFRHLVRRKLEIRGFSVDETDRASDVFTRLEQIRYDLVLTELEFPDLGGKDLIRTIRENPRLKNIDVAILTDLVTVYTPQELMELGASAQYNKADGIDKIVTSIAERLEKQAMLDLLC